MKPWITGATVLLWVGVTAVCAYAYAFDRVTSPDAIRGYETSWRFQLTMFSIFRLPLFVVVLGLLLWLERHFWSGKPA